MFRESKMCLRTIHYINERQPRPQRAFPCKAREKRPGDKVGRATAVLKS